MTSLYHYTNDFLEIKAQLESIELDADLMEDTLESYSDLVEAKVENIIKFREELIALAELQKAEAKRLTEAANQKERKAQLLLSYVDDSMHKLGIKEMQAGLYNVNYRKGSKSTLVDEELLPEEYWVPQPPKPIGKAELKKLVEAGTKIPGVKIIVGPDSLQVKR